MGLMGPFSWLRNLGRRQGERPDDCHLIEDLRTRLARVGCERDGYRAAYLQLEAEIGQARTDAGGYRGAYLSLRADLDRCHADLGVAARERDGYKAAYDEMATDLSRYRSLLRAAVRPPGRPRQVVFLHLQKTGGISLLDFIGRQFEWAGVLTVHSPPELDAYHPGEVAHFDLVCGHLTARNLTAVRPDALLCTFLREPVDRILSCYWYFRTYQGRDRECIRRGVEAARTKSLLEFLRDPDPEIRRHVADHQAHALAGDWYAPDDRPAEDLLAAALESLDRFHVVGLTDEMDTGLARMCRLTGWSPPSARLDRLNTTPTRQSVDTLSAAERDAIRELTTVDAELYRAAKARGAGPAALPT
ncbi:MAG: hypothetical protein JWO38_4775 [Gemmataceae bacterium]|nr:hypothetical protein [Gemmataceae bacterium]